MVPKFHWLWTKTLFLWICFILFDQDQIIWNGSKTYLDYKETYLVQNAFWLFLIKIVDFDQYFDCVTCYGFNYFEPKRSLKKCSSTRRRGLFWKSIRSNFTLKIPIYRIFLTKFYGFENIQRFWPYLTLFEPFFYSNFTKLGLSWTKTSFFICIFIILGKNYQFWF